MIWNGMQLENICVVVFMQFILIVSKSTHISTRQWQPTANKISYSNKQPCFGGLHCVHGRCRRENVEAGEFFITECVCDSGWMGLVCDQRVDAWKSTDQTEERNDAFEITTNTLSNNFEEHKVAGDDGAQVSTKLPGDVIKKSFEGNDARDICSENYTPRSIEERACTTGLLCRFGTCSIEHRDTFIAYTCHCDKGAVGIFCEHKCCLDCGDHGSCHLFPNGTQFCNCKPGFGGERCQNAHMDEEKVDYKDKKIDAALLTYKWAVITGVLILAGIALLTSLATFLIWKTCRTKAKQLIWSLGCHSNKGTSYRNDVLVWYQNNQADDTFVKQVLLPVMEQSALTVHLYTGPSADDKEETLEGIMAYSRKRIIVYSPKFIQAYSAKEARLFKTKIVYLCSKDTFQTLSVWNKVCGLLFRNIYMECPDTENKQEVTLFIERFQSLLPKRTSSPQENAVKTVQCV